MSLYSDILEAVRQKVESIPSLAGVRTTLRKSPAYVALQDVLPQVVIAPNETLSESVDQLQFDNNVFLVFDVFIGIITNAEWDESSLFKRLKWREDIRLTLWRIDALPGVTSVFDCDYNPSPGVAQGWLAGNMDASFQQFSFKASTTRYSE